ncbi:retrovirus-related pol polyprotein from transposon TNT 1-94 [Tanacetum coccineum]
MSGIVPPIPPHLEQILDLPQLPDSRGGSHVTNIPAFDVEDFSSWKDRFLVYLDGLEPYVLECATAKAMWNDLILAHDEPSDTRDTKIAVLRLKFNAFKALEGNKVKGTYRRLKILLNDLENKCVTIPQAEVDATFVNSLPRKWLTLLANHKRFYKRSGRVGSATKPMENSNETCFACGKLDDESMSSEDEGFTKVKAFMAITNDDPFVGKIDARSGQWVKITRKKDYLKRSVDIEGYGSVNRNGIIFTRVAYVNGLEHNLICISQLCDANFKVMITKTQGTIFNQNNEVVLISPRRRDAYKKSDAADCIMSFIRKMENSMMKRSIIVKRLEKTAYEVFRRRSPDISYFHVFGCHVFIHNYKIHLGKFDEKADDGIFLGYSPVAKAFRVFNIRRKETKETYHVTFSEDDEAISQSSTEGDEINFNENYFFPDD